MNGSESGQREAGFVAFAWPRIAVCALIGFIIVASLALLSPSRWQAEVDVLVTRLAVPDRETPVDGGSPRDAELRFANSAQVRDAARGVDPTAPESIDVELDPDTNVMTFTADGDNAPTAQRLAGAWATAYINERQVVLRDFWIDRTELIGFELDALVDELGRARISGDDAEAERLERLRTQALVEEAEATAALNALARDPGAEIFGTGRPATRTGTGFGLATLVGPVVGGLVGAIWAWRRRRQSEDEVEADGWLSRATEGSLAPVLTTRSLEIPNFLDGNVPVAAPETGAPPRGKPTPRSRRAGQRRTPSRNGTCAAASRRPSDLPDRNGPVRSPRRRRIVASSDGS